MSDQQKALRALEILSETCSSSKLALEGDHTTTIDSPPLGILRKDYLSLLTLVYTSVTKASLVLRPSEPAYKASLVPVQDLTKHVSALTTCTALFDEHGRILAQAAQKLTAALIENVKSLADTLQHQDDPANKEYLVRTGAVHDAVEQIRKDLPLDNNAAVQRRLISDRDLLVDCLEEIQEMVNQDKGEGEDEDELDDWDEGGLEELGLGSNKPFSASELDRAKKCGELMRWTCALHKKILRDYQSKAFAGLSTPSIDLLPSHSHQLLLATEDLVASLYAPQDISAILRAISAVDASFQAFRVTLFGQLSSVPEDDVHALEDKLNKTAISDHPVLPKAELPLGYETSYQVLAKCIAKASEDMPPE